DGCEPNLSSIQGVFHHYRTSRGPAFEVLNAYPLMHARGIYEHQRETGSGKRVFLLARTAFAGQQRYGCAAWSGDTFGTWNEFRRQIVSGIQFSLSGLPYWTSDIGGFMPGDVDDHELYVRWFQFVAFCPIFRAHGTKRPREVWQFGGEIEGMLVNTLRLRYRLLPYIYSLAWNVTRQQGTMLRGLMMDFPKDESVWTVADQFLFGPSLLVCPVTERGVRKREVLLPRGAPWYDFYSRQRFEGGRRIVAEAPLERVPLYVKGGTILPFGPARLHAGEKRREPLELIVFPGQDGSLAYYDDEVDGYGYENGKYLEIKMNWRDSDSVLEIAEWAGDYRLEDDLIDFRILRADRNEVIREVRYQGQRIVIPLDGQTDSQRWFL
ncbi:MAG: DUF5110 domain-containing protein, partial [Spirochaetia bacterium]|nr:DUF5110 domain-containing protein [Spirochaetia bacterium]